MTGPCTISTPRRWPWATPRSSTRVPTSSAPAAAARLNTFSASPRWRAGGRRDKSEKERTMVSFLEICRRAITGRIVAPDDFDMEHFVPNLRKAIKKHGLAAPPKDAVIPWDDDLAGRVFLAAK